MKRLAELLRFLNIDSSKIRDEIVSDVVCDSRKVSPGALFICVSGYTVDGHDFVKQAEQNGAIAVIAEKSLSCGLDIPVIMVQDTKSAMQKIVPFFFDYPSRKMKIIGVTGTNGKTTTTNIVYNILENAGHNVALIGTIDIKYAGKHIKSVNTTPDVMELQHVLVDMHLCGIEYVVMEVSSHALALERIDGCYFDVAVLTNITQDHLDLHKDFESYVHAKGLLFSDISYSGKKNTFDIINYDDPSSGYIKKVSTAANHLSYSLNGNTDISVLSYNLHLDSMEVKIKTPVGTIECLVSTTGLFNIYNIMSAVAVAISVGVDLGVVKKTLENFRSVDGRFELVKSGQPFAVVVDYAHTPDGLENVLLTARAVTKGRLITVFGCGGNRDATKRPIMASIAEENSDIVILTSDNPRKEEPMKILSDVEKGIKNKQQTIYFVIPDRKTAIQKAIELAKAEDMVMIAGKGHETYQILNDKTIDFDDRIVAFNALKEVGYVKD